MAGVYKPPGCGHLLWEPEGTKEDVAWFTHLSKYWLLGVKNGSRKAGLPYPSLGDCFLHPPMTSVNFSGKRWLFRLLDIVREVGSQQRP